jgi:hypothetical protein
LEYQHKTLLNVDEIKKSYLQNLRIEKSSNSITQKEYYFQPKISSGHTENKPTTQATQNQTQSRT